MSHPRIKVLDFIRQAGRPVSMAEITGSLSLSRQTVGEAIRQMVRSGSVGRSGGRGSHLTAYYAKVVKAAMKGRK